LKILNYFLGDSVGGDEIYSTAEKEHNFIKCFDEMIDASKTFKVTGKLKNWGTPGLARTAIANTKQFSKLMDKKTRCKLHGSAKCVMPPGMHLVNFYHVDLSDVLIGYIDSSTSSGTVDYARTMPLDKIKEVFFDALKESIRQGKNLQEAKIDFLSNWKAYYKLYGNNVGVFQVSEGLLDKFIPNLDDFEYPSLEQVAGKRT